MTPREKQIITTALYILECQIYADELDCEMESELGPITAEEVRLLMDKIKL